MDKQRFSAYIEGSSNNSRVANFLLVNNFLEEERLVKCRNIYEYIEGLTRYNEVQYNRYIDKSYFKEIEKFLKFYIVAYIKVYKTGKVNLKQAAARIYDFTDEDMDEFGYEEIYEQPKLMDGCDNFIGFYNKLTKDFTNSTGNKIIVKAAGIKGDNRKNYQGKRIPIHSIKELKSLNLMWRCKLDLIEYSKEAEKAYKKIRGNKVNKMSDKNYNELYKLLDDDINNMDEEFKNIYYYKLERKQQYELRKVILKNVQKFSNDEEKIKYIVYSIKYLVANPVLTIREDLANKLYDAIDTTSKYSISEFESESVVIMDIIKKSIKQISDVITKDIATLIFHDNRIDYHEKDEAANERLVLDMKEKLNDLGSNITQFGFFTVDDIKEFRKIYNENGTRGKFQNNYKIKKDYTAYDVELYSKIVHLINQYQRKQIIYNLKRTKIK